MVLFREGSLTLISIAFLMVLAIPLVLPVHYTVIAHGHLMTSDVVVVMFCMIPLYILYHSQPCHT